MMELDGTLLLLQQAAAQDTPIVRTVAERGWFETVTSVASGLMSIALLILTVALVPAAWNFRKSYARINQLLDRVYGDITPLMRHASSIADNVNYITTAVRVDVQEVNRTVAFANQRLRDAVSMTERRVRELHALLDVAQEEAEDLFVSTASTLRGVQTGAAAFQGGREDAAWDEGGDDDDFEEREPPPRSDYGSGQEESENGNDSTAADELRGPAPRIRPRGRGRGAS